MTGRPRRSRRALVAAGAVLAVVVLALGTAGVIWSSTSASADATSSDTSHDVVTEKVASRTLEDTRVTTCTLGHGAATPLAAPVDGTVTWLPDRGATVEPGAPLYGIDGRATVLLRGATPAWRDLAPGVTNGADIAQLKTALADLGRYTPRSGERAEAWNGRLTEAVRAFQRAAGLEVTGSLPLGSVVFMPGTVRIDDLAAPLGQRVSPTSELLSVTGVQRQLSCPVAAADRRFAVPGATASVSFADGAQATGTVTSAATASKAGSRPDNDQGGEPGLTVVLSVPDEQLHDQPDGASAQVAFRAVLAEDAIAVPVTALVALTTGGFAVQVQRPSGALDYVPVTPGVFAGTWVQLTDGDVEVGDQVVVTP